MLQRYATHYPPGFEKLAQTFWPGSLTLYFIRSCARSLRLARAGLPTAGFRVPDLNLTRELIRKQVLW